MGEVVELVDALSAADRARVIAKDPALRPYHRKLSVRYYLKMAVSPVWVQPTAAQLKELERCCIRDRVTPELMLILSADRRSARVDLGRTNLLAIAASKGSLTVLNLLLAHDDSGINRRDDRGATALTWAASQGRAHIVQRLLAVPGVDVYMTDGNGMSALHFWVMSMDNMVVARALIAAGCPKNGEEPVTGRTPLDVAVQRRRRRSPALEAALEQEGCKHGTNPIMSWNGSAKVLRQQFFK